MKQYKIISLILRTSQKKEFVDLMMKRLTTSTPLSDIWIIAEDMEITGENEQNLEINYEETNEEEKGEENVLSPAEAMDYLTKQYLHEDNRILISVFHDTNPFIDMELFHSAMDQFTKQNRTQMTFFRKLLGLTPEIIFDGSLLHEINGEDGCKTLDDWIHIKDTILALEQNTYYGEKPNRYWEDRVSITRNGEYWEDWADDFFRLTKGYGWRVQSDEDLTRINELCSSVGYPTPSRSALNALLDLDMKSNRTIVREAVNNHHKGTRAIRDANIHLAKSEARRGIVIPSSYPIVVYLKITDICNARCKFCKYCPEEVDNFKISLADIQKLDWLRFVKRLYIHNGLGEPFAHPEITEILSYCKDAFPALELRTSTNGSLITEKLSQVIAGYMKNVSISLNAATKETYEKSMPPLKWENVIQNLAYLKQCKEELQTSLPTVNVTYVAHKDNIEELPLLPKIAKELGIEQIGIVYFQYKKSDYIQDYMYPESYSPIYHKNMFNEAVSKTRDLCRDYGIKFHAPANFENTDENHESCEDSPGPAFGFQKGNNICYQPWTRAFLFPLEHLMYICCTGGSGISVPFDFCTSKQFHDTIWNNEIFIKARKMINSEIEIAACTFCKTKNCTIPTNIDLYKKLIKNTMKALDRIEVS